MKRSESIAELAAALATAQADFGAVKKSGTNPMFKNSKYATFDDIIGVVRGPLSTSGLSYMQMLDSADGQPALTTTLMHSSGEWIESTVPLVSISGNRGTNEVQAFGSALTYMKRYALAAMLGVASDEDDDGNSATTERKHAQHQPRPEPAARPRNAAPKTDGASHWIKDEASRKSFWAWAQSKGLTNEQVHTALGVAHVEEYTGSKADAATAITQWASERPFTE